MKYQSAFEIIGPIMVGPSSSHTAGAVRIGNLARQILNDEPTQVSFTLMGSFAETYQGHGTDLALIAGVLGLSTDHPDVANAQQLAEDAGIEIEFKKANFGFYHPNTVSIEIAGRTQKTHLIASSLGGGKVEVQELEELPLKFTGERPTLILYHKDEKGFLARVSQILDAEGYNIGRLMLERWERGGLAITVCEVDEPLSDDTLQVFKETIACLKDIRVVHAD